MKKIRKVKLALIRKIHSKTGYLLNTTSEQRRMDRKINRAAKRRAIRRALREFKPFNWGILQEPVVAE